MEMETIVHRFLTLKTKMHEAYHTTTIHAGAFRWSNQAHMIALVNVVNLYGSFWKYSNVCRTCVFWVVERSSTGICIIFSCEFDSHWIFTRTTAAYTKGRKHERQAQLIKLIILSSYRSNGLPKQHMSSGDRGSYEQTCSRMNLHRAYALHETAW